MITISTRATSLYEYRAADGHDNTVSLIYLRFSEMLRTYRRPLPSYFQACAMPISQVSTRTLSP